MKIAHIVHHFLPESNAGSENYVFQIATEQVKKGHQVFVYTRAIYLNSPQPTRKLETFKGINVVRFIDPVVYMDDWYRLDNHNVEKFLEEELSIFKPDIVHIHHWIALSLSLIKICRKLSLKTVITLHDLFVTCPTVHRMHVDGFLCEQQVNIANCFKCLLEAGANPEKFSTDINELNDLLEYRQKSLLRELKECDRVFVSSIVFLEFLTQFVSIPPEKIKIIPMYATTYGNIPPVKSTQNNNKFNIVYFGSMNYYKAPHLILDAVQKLPSKMRDKVKIYFFGYIYQPEYQKLLEEKSLGLDVFMSKTSYHLSDLLKYTFDLCVLPSIHYESFSFCTSDAIQLELPLIVSDTGVPATRIKKCGLTFKYADAEDLSEKIQRLMLDDKLRNRCRRSCQREKRKFLTPNKHTDTILKNYKKILLENQKIFSVQNISSFFKK